MSEVVATLKLRLEANDQARLVLEDLVNRSRLVADTLDSDVALDDQDRESLLVVLGGVAAMSETIEQVMKSQGSAIELVRRGLLDHARRTISRIDQVLA